ncbi:hypothetical protein BDV59DRAFT_211827 [Aspergillus ambiguus]|uniref:uncharacterized protein n=1 Tax=Aspergillus ambiguus TaxID=176160 RepID=UPI003CCD03DD
MAPSTATPTDLHRAPVACLPCRKAKVRCLVSARRDKCDRCIASNIQCAFVQPKRTRVRHQPYPPSLQRGSKTTLDHDQVGVCEPETLDVPSGVIPAGDRTDVHQAYSSQRTSPMHNRQQRRSQNERPVVTSSIRARMIAALTTLKGKRGAPFSFITSGDNPSFNTGSDRNKHLSHNMQGDQPCGKPQTTPNSLKLSWLLRPLYIGADHEATSDDEPRAGGMVRMPTYLSSLTLGQTITDPLEGGIISSQASQALFDYFMLQMNAKWEYILDPQVDNHCSVRCRSSLLFATVLFCSSKFANYIDGHIVPGTDPFLQSRLCSLSRNLVIKNLASGDRSIETMQALYLLACWKDADDDVSYLHSGYAFGILRDCDLESSDGEGWQVARRRRTWLALVRQDKQQSLFFVRKASPSQGDDDVSFLTNPDVWLQMQNALPFDFVAACSADLRRIQSKLRVLVRDASPIMLPCLQELMDAELASWRLKWKNHLQWQDKSRSNYHPAVNPGLIDPGGDHLAVLVEVWEQSVRLNVSSALLRQSLLRSVTLPQRTNGQPTNTLLDFDLANIQQALSPTLPGLSSSIKGAFGTLQNLMKFPPHELRQAPDTIILLAPSAALFLCLLLCLPPEGILGSAFQVTAIDLIRDIAHHIGQCVQSAHDTVVLHSTYLNSLVELLDPAPSQLSAEQQYFRIQPTFDISHIHIASGLEDGINDRNNHIPQTDYPLSPPGDGDQNLHLQNLVNLLDGDLFWDMLPGTDDTNTSI